MSGENYVGGIVGRIYTDKSTNSATLYQVKDCSMDNLIVEGDNYIGGAVGESYGITVSNISNTKTCQVKGVDYVGGFIG